MIFYFSGTGNSRWVANQLQAAFDDTLVLIADELNNHKEKFTYTLGKEEKVFFVFPVHSWGPAVLIQRFLDKVQFDNYHGQSIYMVCTCGDECGYTMDIFHTMLIKKNLSLTKGYSIIMPNNYILMKGFDVDNKQLEKEKLEDAPIRMKEIIENIQQQEKEKIYKIGKLPFLKSKIIYPLFIKYAVGKNKFYAKENCTSCKLCVKICPTKTIVMQEGKPQWGNNCVQCTACIHRCPVQAIEYGNVSRKKGRYHHPDLK